MSRVVRLLLAAVVTLALAWLASVPLRIWWDARQEDHRSSDAIVVLGAAQYDGRPSPVLEARLRKAQVLYEEGVAPVIVTVGAGQEGDRTTEAEAGRDYLVSHGVPSTSVIALPEGRSTIASMRAAARYLRDQGMDTAFLVSDPWHNARIERMSGDLGLQGHASATWTSAATSQRSRSEGYLRETFAYLYYRIVGR